MLFRRPPRLSKNFSHRILFPVEGHDPSVKLMSLMSVQPWTQENLRIARVFRAFALGPREMGGSHRYPGPYLGHVLTRVYLHAVRGAPRDPARKPHCSASAFVGLCSVSMLAPSRFCYLRAPHHSIRSSIYMNSVHAPYPAGIVPCLTVDLVVVGVRL